MKQSPYFSILSKYPPRREFLLSMMHDIQKADKQNHIPIEALKAIAAYTKLSMAAVMGVVEYYSMLSSKPRGRFLVRICVSPICINHKSDHIIKKLLNHFQLKELGEVSVDGAISIETSECLGKCHEGPAISINEHYLDNITEENVISQIEQYIKSNTNDK